MYFAVAKIMFQVHIESLINKFVPQNIKKPLTWHQFSTPDIPFSATKMLKGLFFWLKYYNMAVFCNIFVKLASNNKLIKEVLHS